MFIKKPQIATYTKIGILKSDNKTTTIKNGFLKQQPKIVSFSTGTDEQIADMLNAYYNNKITQSDMGQAIGDTRLIHFDAMKAPKPYDNIILPSQDITIVIVAHNHTDLAVPINGHTKACITVQTRECLHDLNSHNEERFIYINGDSSYDTTFTKQSDLYMRFYLNNIVLQAMPSNLFKSIIKGSMHRRRTTGGSSGSGQNDNEQIIDTLFLPSVSEFLYNSSSSSQYYGVEGTQFEYYTVSSNRIKYGNNNGEPNNYKSYYQTSSASSEYSSTYGYYQVSINSSGSSSTYSSGNDAYALAPAQAM